VGSGDPEAGSGDPEAESDAPEAGSGAPEAGSGVPEAGSGAEALVLVPGSPDRSYKQPLDRPVLVIGSPDYSEKPPDRPVVAIGSPDDLPGSRNLPTPGFAENQLDVEDH
jgi:hypothetical protein